MYNTYPGTVALESLPVIAWACGPWEVYDGAAFSAAGRIWVNESAAVKTGATTAPSDLQRYRGCQL